MTHTDNQPLLSRTAGFPGDLDAAMVAHQPAAQAGLTEEVLICAAQVATRLEPNHDALEHKLDNVKRARRSRLASFDRDDQDIARAFLELQRLRQQIADGEASRRTRSPDLVVVAAAAKLIEWVQGELRKNSGVLPWPLAPQLRATQRIAFNAMWRPRVGHADAKRVQLKVSNHNPLAICERCNVVFADKTELGGRKSISPYCPEHKT